MTLKSAREEENRKQELEIKNSRWPSPPMWREPMGKKGLKIEYFQKK